MKSTILLIVMVVLGAAVQAQGVFSIGPKVGYNSNNLTADLDSIQASLKNSFQFGAFVRVGSRLYFQPEANYQVSESTMKKGTGSKFQSQDITLKSLKVPLLIGYKIIKKGAVNLRVMAGPAVTFVLNKKLTPSSIDELWPVQSADDIRNNSWSVQMGAGLDVFFITLDVRYEMGIDNMYNGSTDLQLKNNIFNVSLGIKLL